MTRYQEVQTQLKAEPKIWALTGVAGFIGSNLLEMLLKLDQTVIGLDNFVTGHQRNLDEVQSLVSPDQWARFTMIVGDICEIEDCRKVVTGVDYVLHQAALGSVPRSLNDPIRTHKTNADGFLNMLVAARDAGVKQFVYAASSSTYGDHPGLPKVEDRIGKTLSPYAVTKYLNEMYADVFGRCYGMSTIGLRYFNVFGSRQDPEGSYAAVIPKWFGGMFGGEEIFVNGDGETSRDFCYIANAVQANILAAVATDADAVKQVYNVAVGGRTSLNELYSFMRALALEQGAGTIAEKPTYRDFRAGDVRHSQADISKAASRLGYAPQYSVRQGLEQIAGWYQRFFQHESLMIDWSAVAAANTAHLRMRAYGNG